MASLLDLKNKLAFCEYHIFNLDDPLTIQNFRDEWKFVKYKIDVEERRQAIDREILASAHFLYDLCQQQGYGEPFNYSRGKEIFAAIQLGHQVASTYGGADAFHNEKSK